MRYVILMLLCITISFAFAADRIVLFEDFTNSGCGPCWMVEPQVNSFVNAHLSSGDLAVMRVHVNWPSPSDPIYLANPTEQYARKAVYGINSVPTFKMDGVLTPSAYTLQNAFNTRSAVPTYLGIFVARNGNDQTGTVSIRLIAEQDLENQTTMRLYSVLVENNVPGAGYWAGSVFEQAFRDNLAAYPYGDVVEFEAPYPDTVYFEFDYDITAWENDELHLTSFVQQIGPAFKDVMNAHWSKFMDLETGIEGSAPSPAEPSFTVISNPCRDFLNVQAVLPDGTHGTISVFNIAGRSVASAPAGKLNSFFIREAGVYFVRLTTDTELQITETVTVLR